MDATVARALRLLEYQRVASRNYYQRNKDAIKARSVVYWQQHRDGINARRRQRYAARNVMYGVPVTEENQELR